MTDDSEQALAALARVANLDPDKVLADYRHGGPLADLARVLLGERRRRPGPRSDVRENWRRFVLVVLAKRRSSADPFAEAAEIGQQGDDDPGDAAPSRYHGNYHRMRRTRGWRDEHVPLGLGALFSSPPE